MNHVDKERLYLTWGEIEFSVDTVNVSKNAHFKLECKCKVKVIRIMKERHSKTTKAKDIWGKTTAKCQQCRYNLAFTSMH